MSEIPGWWLWVSGIFFVLQSLFLVALGVVLFKALEVLRTLPPKVEATSRQVNQLLTTVQGVASKVDGIAANVQTTVSTVNGSVQRVSGTMGAVSEGAAPVLTKAAPILGYLALGLKVLQMVQGLRRFRR